MKTKIIAHQIDDYPCILKPAVKERQWMDETPYKYAYRCLPLNISNSTGWDLFPPCNFMVLWSSASSESKESISIQYEEEGYNFACSIFGSGIFTIHPGYLFETNEDVDLMVMGPPNFPIDFAYPLSGIVETWWLNFTFTMNWKMQKYGFFHWTTDMPLCRIIPIPHNYNIEAEVKDIKETSELYKRFTEYANSREKKISDLDESYKRLADYGDVVYDKPSTQWQKHYLQGIDIDGTKHPGHITKRKFPNFKRKDGKDNSSKSD